MKHKHYEMIMAKAANMELVVFLENDQGWSEKENQSDIQFHEQFDYFLCLPQHKESCLHWLNGGVDLDVKIYSGNWFDYSIVNTGKPWSYDRDFMQSQHWFRIKPKKEKRWIGLLDGDFLAEKHFESELDLRIFVDKKYADSVARRMIPLQIKVEV